MQVTVISQEQLENTLRKVLNEFQFHNAESTDKEEPSLNQKEAADFLGISQTTIIKWKNEGKIPYEQAPGSSKVRFYKSQLLTAVRQKSHLLQPARK